MLKYFILILCYLFCKIGILNSKDIREFEVGTSIKSIPEERYTNIRCLDSEKLLKLWDDYNLCKKRNDDNFKIYLIRGMNIVKNKKDCLKIKETIAEDLKELFPKFYFLEGSQKHYYYKNSTQYISQFSLTSDANKSDHVRVECMIIDDKDKKIHGELVSTLEVIIASKEFNLWLASL